MGIKISKKRLLVEFHNYTCEECKKKFKFEELRIHRINRGYAGGTYENHRNLKVLCVSCHKMYHSGEFK